MKKAIFFDIDGTLIDARAGVPHFSPRLRAALKNLQNAGHYIFIATGRPRAFLQREILDFGFDGFIMSNGALIILHDQLFFQSKLDINAVKKICDFAVSENIEYMLEGYPKIYCPKGFTACEAFFNKIGVDYSNFIRDFDFDNISVSKIECVSARTDFDALNDAYNKIIATPGFTGWADPFHFKSLEIYSADVSKATGILKVLNHFNIDVKNSFAFGDGFNDREMIQTVGTGFVMDTAKDDLKKFATHIVPSVHDDGVAFGIENFIL